MQYLVYAYFFVRPLQISEWDLSCHVVACEGWIFDRWSCKDFMKTSGSSEKGRSLWKIVSFLILSKTTLYSNTCRAAVKKSSQKQPGNQAAQLSAHTGTQSCIDIVPGSYQSCNSPAQVRIQDARLGRLKAVAGDAVVVIFQVVFFRFQIIFLCPTGGGESWHQPRPGLRLWDRPDQQACPVTSFQECGIGGYDGEFPGWGAELPTGQRGQSRDVLLQKPPGIHSSSAKIWCHLDSVGFRLVQHDSSSLGSRRTIQPVLKLMLKEWCSCKRRFSYLWGCFLNSHKRLLTFMPRHLHRGYKSSWFFSGHILEEGACSWRAACVLTRSWGVGLICEFSGAEILLLTCQCYRQIHGAGLTCEQGFLNLATWE